MPADFEIPESVSFGEVIIEPLTPEYAILDYEAVMESREELRAYFGGEWPPDSFTIEANTKELEDHQQFANQRISFAYTVLNKDRTQVIGCIYVNPTDSAGFDAQVHSWLRSGQIDFGFHDLVGDWMKDQWPFERVIYW